MRVWRKVKGSRTEKETGRVREEGKEQGSTEAVLEWDSMCQQKKRILFEIPHLHFCYKSKGLEHFCLREWRQKEGKRDEQFQ